MTGVPPMATDEPLWGRSVQPRAVELVAGVLQTNPCGVEAGAEHPGRPDPGSYRRTLVGSKLVFVVTYLLLDPELQTNPCGVEVPSRAPSTRRATVTDEPL